MVGCVSLALCAHSDVLLHCCAKICIRFITKLIQLHVPLFYSGKFHCCGILQAFYAPSNFDENDI